MRRLPRIHALSLLLSVVSAAWLAASDPTCLQQACGNMSIPYPFGIAPGCGLPDFHLNCTATRADVPSLPFQGTGEAGAAYPFLWTDSGPFQVLGIYPATIVINVTNVKAVSCDGPGLAHGNASFSLPKNSWYALSPNNQFFVNGCNSTGNVTTDVSNGTASCVTSCDNNAQNYAFCNIYACCVSNLAAGSREVAMYGGGIRFQGGGCGFASLLYPPSFLATDKYSIETGHYGLELSYALRGHSCADTAISSSVCSGNASCIDVDDVWGFVCNCDGARYVGDGYTAGSGCLDLDECAVPASNRCAPDADCINTVGGYTCWCVGGYRGDGFTNGTGCTQEQQARSRDEKLAIGASVASLGFLFALAFLALRYLNSRQSSRKQTADSVRADIAANNNRSSHREMLVRAGQGVEGAAQLFSLAELEAATDGFSEERKVGAGGCGTVFKGTLLRGGTDDDREEVEVAIKRTNDMCVHNLGQFYNEVTVLSQVNHRNLVRLLGCCIETEVPMLVYEYVANGSLYDYLHGEGQEQAVAALDWDHRLRIATDTAEALAYMHSAAEPPIYHRDMKTANILLDHHLTAKVADFGLSKLVPHHATHVSTMVKGTPGYLDPEYYQNYQVTDKSDVYGFGVVLLELITGQKPLDFSRDPNNVNLAAMAFSCHKRGAMHHIVHPPLIRADTVDSIAQVTQLAIACLAFHRVDRPTMKQVVEVLARVKRAAGKGAADSNPLAVSPPCFDHLLAFDPGSPTQLISSTNHSCIQSTPLR